MRTLKSVAARVPPGTKRPLIVLVIVGYLMACLVGSLFIFSEYFNTDAARPISTGAYLIVFFLAAPLLILAYGLLEAAVAGAVTLLVAWAKALRR